ncbi:MAG: sensor histidine kinase [Bacteroidetes bacterium]|nr:MAG: sensor histidine kinase [Bacteroidota bacterium]
MVISDNGTGIPSESIPKIFEMFYTTKAPGEGTGLGLYVCHDIMKAHGGHIKITSNHGYETFVEISLPSI